MDSQSIPTSTHDRVYLLPCKPRLKDAGLSRPVSLISIAVNPFKLAPSQSTHHIIPKIERKREWDPSSYKDRPPTRCSVTSHLLHPTQLVEQTIKCCSKVPGRPIVYFTEDHTPFFSVVNPTTSRLPSQRATEICIRGQP
jgi:hypothetical protein